MKKFFALILIGFFSFLITGCREDNNGDGGDNDNVDNEDNPPVVEITKEEKEYLAYMESLNAIVNVEKNKIFEDYGKFTDELEKYVYFGDYPGREVSNQMLVEHLEKITGTNEFGYIEFENLKFVKVVIKNTYTSLEIGSQGYENSTQYKIGTTHYFLVEPILWRVLNYNSYTNEAFLISNNIVDAKMYVNETAVRFLDGRNVYPSNYEYSDIRNWCNNVFYNQAFSDNERSIINYVENNNECNVYPDYADSLYGYVRSTQDYVFLPSYQEVTDPLYGFDEFGYFSYSRFCEPSNYASAKGVYTSKIEKDLPNSGLYLLRTGNEFTKSFSYFVKFDGYALNPYYVNSPSTGVRVCVKINLETDI